MNNDKKALAPSSILFYINFYYLLFLENNIYLKAFFI